MTGPPAAGKSTFSQLLLQRYARGFHIPVDDLREWVVAGIATPEGWCEETTRQFSLAEHAAADLACRYQDAGFAVAIDHCHNTEVLNRLIEDRFQGRQVVKVLLLPSLECNLRRNRERRNKAFDPEILAPTIVDLNSRYRDSNDGWIVLDNESVAIETTVDLLLVQIGSNFRNLASTNMYTP